MPAINTGKYQRVHKNTWQDKRVDTKHKALYITRLCRQQNYMKDQLKTKSKTYITPPPSFFDRLKTQSFYLSRVFVCHLSNISDICFVLAFVYWSLFFCFILSLRCRSPLSCLRSVSVLCLGSWVFCLLRCVLFCPLFCLLSFSCPPFVLVHSLAFG